MEERCSQCVRQGCICDLQREIKAIERTVLDATQTNMDTELDHVSLHMPRAVLVGAELQHLCLQ